MITLKCSCCGYEENIKKRLDKNTYNKLTHNKSLLCGKSSCKKDELTSDMTAIEEPNIYGNWTVVRSLTKAERKEVYRSWLNAVLILREQDLNNTEIRKGDLIAIAGAKYNTKNPEKFVDEVLKLASDINSLTGKKNITLAEEDGYIEICLNKNGLINNNILETEDFYSYILNILEKGRCGLNIRQFITKSGKNDIYKVYGVNISNGTINYITAEELEWSYSFDPFTGKSLPKPKGLYFSQLE